MRRLIDILRSLGCRDNRTPNPPLGGLVTYSGLPVTWGGEGVTYNA